MKAKSSYPTPQISRKRENKQDKQTEQNKRQTNKTKESRSHASRHCTATRPNDHHRKQRNVRIQCSTLACGRLDQGDAKMERCWSCLLCARSIVFEAQSALPRTSVSARSSSMSVPVPHCQFPQEVSHIIRHTSVRSKRKRHEVVPPRTRLIFILAFLRSLRHVDGV